MRKINSVLHSIFYALLISGETRALVSKLTFFLFLALILIFLHLIMAIEVEIMMTIINNPDEMLIIIINCVFLVSVVDIVITNVQCDLFPDLSMAVTATMVSPT